MKKKTFLECMFNDLDDIHEGTDKQVEEELISMNIDINKAKKLFKDTLKMLKSKYNRYK